MIRFAIAVPLIGIAVYLIVTQSFVTKAVVLSRLESAFGLEIQADHVFIRRDGVLVLVDVVARAPGVASQAGTIFEVHEAKIEMDWGALIMGGGGVGIGQITLVKPVLRVSQSSKTGRLTLAEMDWPSGSGGGGGGRGGLPKIVAEEGIVELGEHEGEHYTVLKRLNLKGSLDPNALAGDGVYDLKLEQISGVRGMPFEGKPIRFVGQITPEDVTVDLMDIALDTWDERAIPSLMRKQFSQLELAGQISTARVRYHQASGLADVSIRLDGVGLNLPLGAGDDGLRIPELRPFGSLSGMVLWLYDPAALEDEAGKPDKRMRLEQVFGTIEFRGQKTQVIAEGLLEDLPYKIDMTYDGTSSEAPFTASLNITNYEVTAQTKLHPFLPVQVRQQLAMFSGPSARILAANVNLKRGEPVEGKVGEFEYNGFVQFDKGAASYKFFPYPFTELAGRIDFNKEKVSILEVSGKGPTGARLIVSGQVLEPAGDSTLDLDLRLLDVPMDTPLFNAIGEEKAQLLEQLFSKAGYSELIELGLILGAEANAKAGPEAAGELAKMTQRLREERSGLMRFELGGVARQISIELHGDLMEDRPLDASWSQRIEIQLPEVGILAEMFQYPIIGQGVRIVISSDRIELEQGEYASLSGHPVEVKASAKQYQIGSEVGFEPSILIHADAIDLDPLLIHAIQEPEGFSLRQMLTDFSMRGAVGCGVTILERDTGEIGFDVTIAVADVSAVPSTTEGEGKVEIAGIDGTIRINERGLELSIEGKASSREHVGSGFLDRPVSVQAQILFEDVRQGVEGSHRVNVLAQGVSLEMELEDVAGVFSSEAGEWIEQTRAEREPRGVVDLGVEIWGQGEEPGAIRVVLEQLEEVSFDVFGDRLALSDCAGAIELELGKAGVLRAREFGSSLKYGNVDDAKLSAQGEVPMGQWKAGEFDRFKLEPMVVRIGGARFEWTLLERLLGKIAGGRAHDVYESLEPRGRFDLELSLAPGQEGLQEAETETKGDVGVQLVDFSRLETELVIEPASLTIQRGGRSLEVGQIAGQIVLTEEMGRVVGLTGEGEGWSFGVDGSWDGGLGMPLGEAELNFSLQGEHGQDDLLALLPDSVGGVLDELDARILGPVSFERGRFTRLRVEGADEEAMAGGDNFETRMSGKLLFEDASINVGLEVTEARGWMGVVVHDPGGGGAGDFEIDLVADRLKAAGVQLTHGVMRIEGTGSLTEEGSGVKIFVPLLAADCYGGRISAEAVVGSPGRDQEGKQAQATYETTIRLAGVALDPVVHDVSLSQDEGSSTQEGEPADGAVEHIDHGAKLDAFLTLRGVVGDDSLRTGRGSFRIFGGRVVDRPLLLPMIEVSNLAIPTGEGLDYVESWLFVNGSTVTFESISAFSRSLAVFGFGTMEWPGLELDLRFKTKAARPIPVISRLMDQIRDELLLIRVTGQLGKQEASVEQFTSARRLIGLALGDSQAVEHERLLEIEKRARHKRRRGRMLGFSDRKMKAVAGVKHAPN